MPLISGLVAKRAICSPNVYDASVRGDVREPEVRERGRERRHGGLGEAGAARRIGAEVQDRIRRFVRWARRSGCRPSPWRGARRGGGRARSTRTPRAGTRRSFRSSGSAARRRSRARRHHDARRRQRDERAGRRGARDERVDRDVAVQQRVANLGAGDHEPAVGVHVEDDRAGVLGLGLRRRRAPRGAPCLRRSVPWIGTTMHPALGGRRGRLRPRREASGEEAEQGGEAAQEHGEDYLACAAVVTPTRALR